jgi:putative ABC transport system permease protein
MGSLWRDLRHGTRTLIRNPGFGVTAVVLVALGVGAVTTVFTLVDRVLLRPLPYPAAERLVVVGQGAHSGGDLEDVRAELPAVEAWGAVFDRDAILTGEGPPLRIRVGGVDDGFLPLLGARAHRGRLLGPDDAGDPSVGVLAWAAWRGLFGEDPEVVGRTLRVDGEPVRVVGVAAPGFAPPEAVVAGEVALWRPLDFTAPELSDRSYSVLELVGRLAPGVSLERAQEQMDALVRRQARAHPDVYVHRDGSVEARPLVPLSELTVAGVRQGLHLLLGAVAVLLLVACANVAHLFLARGVGRVHEMGIRRALGADQGTLVRQLLAESVVLAGVGGALGALLAAVAVPTFLAWAPRTLPRLHSAGPDLRILAFALGLSLLAAVLFGLIPALRALGSRGAVGPGSGVRGASAGRRSTAVRRGLVVAEVALSMVLLAQGLLLVRSFSALTSVEPGVRAQGVWTVPLPLTDVDEASEWTRRGDRIREALEALPSVEAATYGMTMPFQHVGGSRCCWSTGVTVPGEEAEPVRTAIHAVEGSYFRVLDIPFRIGTSWSPADRDRGLPPVVVNETLARSLFGSPGAAVGRQVAYGGPEPAARQVVGVVPDGRHYGLDQEHGPALYAPPRIPFPLPRLHLAVLAPRAPHGLPDRLREAIWSVEPATPVPTVRPLEGWLAASAAESRFRAVLATAFGAVALILAAGGLYGTLLYTVGARRRELGIRMALGAAAGSVQRRVLADGLLQGLVGVVLGVGGALLAGRLLESRLYGVGARDPLSLAAAAALLLAVVGLASWLPARRAARTDPVRTLTAE